MTREIALEILKSLDVYRGGDIDQAIQFAIKALEQEPKTGYWIKVTNGRGGHECDLCHDYAPSYQSGDEYLSAFCPNCGAKMEGNNDI